MSRSSKPAPPPLDTFGDVLSVQQAAEVLGISDNAYYEAIKRREVPALKIGRRLIVPKAALRRLLECPPPVDVLPADEPSTWAPAAPLGMDR